MSSINSDYNKQHNLLSCYNNFRNLAKLSIGQPLIHLEHGVGRYLGLVTLNIGNIQSEYLVLSYADDIKLYVPIYYLHLINRYSSIDNQKIPLHKLGSDTWLKIKKKTFKKIKDTAAELLNIYSKRAITKGFAFKAYLQEYQKFCQECPFEATLDQKNVINEIIKDMCQVRAMDRLLCGDVGFGKTEVAMRAAFIAVKNGKQVAILVPTTILAQQHYDNFRNRFSKWQINIEVLSRFKTSKNNKDILDRLERGNINIIIGTHKILTNNIRWYDLGLLIIDEEQRFGVYHKEHIKDIYPNIDILTLTATPIPRTMNMIMNGIRDLSIIKNPPSNRVSVETFICEYDNVLVKKAILREIERGGQVYYLYNNIKNIQKKAIFLAKLVPEISIKISHSKMNDLKLEQLMSDFYHKKFQLLLCTSIIEVGLDIPNVNTIIIERADKFGLSQLHQLRGRVGRSTKKAYAWLFIPNIKLITADAQKRLHAITSLGVLGSGFSLATTDLEIRGAGELLGTDQSGQIESIGLSLYMELLETTKKALKSGLEPTLDDLNKPKIELYLTALLPKNFISDINQRLVIYKSLTQVTDLVTLTKIKNEIINKFGELPAETNNLLDITEISIIANNIGVSRIEKNKKGILFEFKKINNINLDSLLKIIQKKPNQWHLKTNTCLQFFCDTKDNKYLINYIKYLLNIL